jgi:hypothetical protein
LFHSIWYISLSNVRACDSTCGKLQRMEGVFIIINFIKTNDEHFVYKSLMTNSSPCLCTPTENFIYTNLQITKVVTRRIYIDLVQILGETFLKHYFLPTRCSRMYVGNMFWDTKNFTRILAHGNLNYGWNLNGRRKQKIILKDCKFSK